MIIKNCNYKWIKLYCRKRSQIRWDETDSDQPLQIRVLLIIQIVLIGVFRMTTISRVKRSSETWRCKSPCCGPSPSCSRPYASTTPSPKCPLACGPTHQITSPGTRVPPYRVDIMRGISGGVDILPARQETMTIRELRPFPHTISDHWEVMASYPSFYDITPHPCWPVKPHNLGDTWHRTQKPSVSYVAIGGGAKCFAQPRSPPDMLKTLSLRSASKPAAAHPCTMDVWWKA